MWAENRFIIFIPVPDPDFRQLRAADPRAGRVGYKKRHKGVQSQPLQNYEAAMSTLISDPPPQCVRGTHWSPSAHTYVRTPLLQ